MDDNDLEVIDCFGCDGEVPIFYIHWKPEPNENTIIKPWSRPWCSDECYKLWLSGVLWG